MKVSNIYTSVACNRTPQSADWGNNGLICYGACNSVAIFDPNYNGSAKITKTFVQHKKRVNTVKWIRKTQHSIETEIISGSDDGTAIIWDIVNPEEVKYFILKGHESGINVIDTAYVGEKLTIATASADSSIKLWSFNENSANFECFQTILLQDGFSFALRLSKLPHSEQLILAYSGDDSSILLWTEIKNADSKVMFTKIHKLIGHEDWVRGLDFASTLDGDLLLASSAQDNFIRLWKISARSKDQFEQNKLDILKIPDGDIQMEEKMLQIKNVQTEKVEVFAVSLESVLYGHEAWVYGVHWHQNENGLQLLSASIDKTLIIWSMNDDGVWMDKVRVGAVGGNSLGFFGGKFSSNGKSIFGHGYQGGFHIWNKSNTDENLWEPNVIIGGHFGEVRDLSWEPEGEFLFSVSADQTTRIHGPWVRSELPNEITWHELARPQVHGYDMQAIAVLSRYKFASGAEEKIVRTFKSPGNFIENFHSICNISIDEEGDELLKGNPKGASVPSLGLSNIAVYNSEKPAQEKKHVKDEYPENYFVPVNLTCPPQEETLMQNTLWPETQKLYGHGFEIFALASSTDGKVLASSCRATSSEHAQIIIWDGITWKQCQKLSAHQLTVTQLSFSPDNKYLLSVSRDRTWSLFAKTSSEIFSYQLAAKSDKTNGLHARIIWSCDWSHDSKMFVTSSRDGKAIIWTESETETETSLKKWMAIGVKEIKNESITAVAFAKEYLNNKSGEYLLAFGLENGLILLKQFNGKWEDICTIENNCAHHSTVRRLRFRPKKDTCQLASCGDDNFVRIYDVQL